MKTAKKIICALFSVMLIFSLSLTAFASESDANRFENLFREYLQYDSEYSLCFEYRELYSHYGSADSTIDEATPDYVLVNAYDDCSPAYAYDIYGNYILNTDHFGDYSVGHYIVVPSENNRIYTLREAWDTQLDGVEAVFTEYGLGGLIGDLDGDRNITIKDATYIQKCIAGLTQFPENDEVRGIPVVLDGSPDDNVQYISDFDRNDDRNIKDATAIQKYIAGIDWRDEDDNNYRPSFEDDCA